MLILCFHIYSSAVLGINMHHKGFKDYSQRHGALHLPIRRLRQNVNLFLRIPKERAVSALPMVSQSSTHSHRL
jgi:hypothetical protein